MKIIRLNENQLFKLLESNSNSAPNFNNGDVKEYNGSEVMTTANVTSPDGEEEYGKPTDADKIQKSMAMQNFWLSGQRGLRAM